MFVRYAYVPRIWFPGSAFKNRCKFASRGVQVHLYNSSKWQ